MQIELLLNNTLIVIDFVFILEKSRMYMCNSQQHELSLCPSLPLLDWVSYFPSVKLFGGALANLLQILSWPLSLCREGSRCVLKLVTILQYLMQHASHFCGLLSSSPSLNPTHILFPSYPLDYLCALTFLSFFTSTLYYPMQPFPVLLGIFVSQLITYTGISLLPALIEI